ncbi:MAG: tetratricopeptide repeat protein [Dongiaceae bacterium]
MGEQVRIGWTMARGAPGVCGVIALITALNTSALAQDLPSAGDVTYDQVLENPDDLTLSYRFALKQIEDGDLLGASATLDRLILPAPQEPNNRAPRAIVLYRLGNLREAGDEFEQLLLLDLDPKLKSNIERYAAAVDQQSKRTRVNLLLSLGYQFDSNRAGGNKVDNVRTVVGNFELNNAAPTEDDHSLQALARLSIEHDPPGQDRHMLFANATIYDGDQFDLDDFDTQSVGAQAGVRLEIDPIFVTPSITYNHLWLGEESYLDIFQAEARYDWRVNDPINLFGAFALVDYDYHVTDNYPTAGDQSGLDASARIGLDWYLGSDHRLTFALTHRQYDAEVEFETFDGDRLNIDHVWLIGSGIFLVTNLSAEWDRYDELDPLFVGDDREDIIYRARMTLGVPVVTIAGAVQTGFLDGLLLSTYGEYYRQDSNHDLNEFENIRGGIAVSKRFEF